FSVVILKALCDTKLRRFSEPANFLTIFLATFYQYFWRMGRIMAIDYGSKRVGLAVTDPLQIIASGLTTVHSKDLIAFLEDYFKKETVD
ncbi:Holliday junction resolvase RuvX, partial [Salmonella enterica subsp. enterica serovar Typhimurium]|nr:Holliday junction resolvase RuvX [Salmonella enterica subsp. enterica serovar Typhimurium]